MKKPILFKRTRESVIRKLSSCFDCSRLTILELFYVLFHLKELNEIFDNFDDNKK